MTNQLDEKKYAIIALLIKLREFDPSIGKYIDSSKNEKSDYTVKLHNGKIILSQQMIEDFERNNSLLNAETLKMAAFNFVPNKQEVNPLSSKQEKSAFSNSGISTDHKSGEQSNSRVQKIILISVAILLAVLVTYLVLARKDF